MANISTFSYTLSTCRYRRSLQAQFETPRLIIRNITENDLSHSKALYGNKEITQFFDYGSPKTSAEVHQLYETGTEHFAKGKPWGIFSIFSKETGSFLGHIDIFPSADGVTLEIGYILTQEAQGLGIGTEAAEYLIHKFIPSLISEQFIESHHTSFMATVHPENIASRKVLEKIGMRKKSSQTRFNQPRDLYTLQLAI